jgi:coenzyme F420-reducing hydrogenase alpha subunit
MSRDAKAASRFRGLLTSERNSADLYSGLADAATGATLTSLCVKSIRNHDPCISCSAHFLTPTIDRR